jgi:hypothetical protein
MGLARSDYELRRAAEIASTVGGVRRVVSFMQVRAPDLPYYAQAAGPEFRGPDGVPADDGAPTGQN